MVVEPATVEVVVGAAPATVDSGSADSGTVELVGAGGG